MGSEAVPKTVAIWLGELKLGSRLGSIVTVGGVVSNEKSTVRVADPMFPSRSEARMVMTFVPATRGMVADQLGAAKVACPVPPVRLFDQFSWETAVSSTAVPEMTKGRTCVVKVGG